MTNPMRAVILNGRNYAFVEDSFRESVQLKNTDIVTYGSRTFSALGSAPSTYSLVLNLESNYLTREGEVFSAGRTTWLGISRLHDLKTFMGGQGVSLPIPFVTPYGVTVNVVPTGALDIEIFNPSNPSATYGVEFRVSISLSQAI